MSRINVGIIGCGAVAEKCHLPAVRGIPEIKVKALADINQENALRLAEKFDLKDASILTDYRQLLRNADVDAVWILTPPQLHAKMIADAIRFGKHVLCEKPIATTLKEVEMIRKTLRDEGENAQNLILMPAHNFIFTMCFSHSLNLLGGGEIGKLREIKAHTSSNLMFYGAKMDFRMQAKGGVIEDQMPHVIYLSQKVGGPIEKILSITPRRKGRTVVEDVQVEAEFRDGVKAVLSASWSGFIPTLRFEVTGESGRISMDLLRTPYNLIIVRNGEAERIRMGRSVRQYLDVLRSMHPSYFYEHMHFLGLIDRAIEPLVTMESGFALVEVLDKIIRTLDESSSRTTFDMRKKVALVRIEVDVEAAVRESIRLIGGLNIKKDARVVVKPNVCFWRNTESMIITDPMVLRAVLRMVKEKTANVLVVESDNNSGTADERIRKSGVLEVIEDCGTEFLNLSRDEYEEHEVAGSVIRIPKTALEADYFINLPKIKTCNIENMLVTIAMKNMFGVLADKKKVRLHKNLMEALLYINKAVRQDMVIVDGIVAMEGLGPIWGTPVPLNLIVSGLNPVTVDAVCCHVMGINPYAVEAIWNAYKAGMGEIDVNRVEILGEKLENVKRSFRHPVFLTKNITGAIRTAFKTYL